MAERPAVSVVIIFLDEERFLGEAIDSVLAQTFQDFELLLVDDGSSDASTALARETAARDPGRIRYLAHPGGANLGMSASRNLGIEAARAPLIASLDGDDVWLPRKLERQTELLSAHPEAAMTFGPLLRWRTWTGEAGSADQEDLMGVGRRKFGVHPLAGGLVPPPELARRILSDDYFIPGGALIRRDALLDVGGYDPGFRSLYEDAVVMVKLAASYSAVVDDHVVYRYRMHPDSCTNRENDDVVVDERRAAYLERVAAFIDERGIATRGLRLALWRAKRSRRRHRRRRHQLLSASRAIGRLVLPRAVRDRLRSRWRAITRPIVAEP